MVEDATTREVGGAQVRGLAVDGETRCVHYDGDSDVVALAFPCCEAFYPCFRCHDAVADHGRERWGSDDRDVRAILCGACGERLSVAAYLAAAGACPACGHAFNPGCATHYDRYFRSADLGDRS